MTAKRKTALITGSSKGLGKELALEFSRNEYDIIIHGRDETALGEVDAQTRKHEVNVYSVVGDITQVNTLVALAQEARARNINVLVNNAGIYLKKPATEMTMEELRKLMEVNFLSHVDLTKRILPIFLNKKEGLIVNINSIAGEKGSPEESAYSASKHALKGFFDSLRYEVTKQGVRILDVYSGAIKTQMTRDRKTYPLLMNPEEVAKEIVKNCELSESLSVSRLDIGRIKYE